MSESKYLIAFKFNQYCKLKEFLLWETWRKICFADGYQVLAKF